MQFRSNEAQWSYMMFSLQTSVLPPPTPGKLSLIQEIFMETSFHTNKHPLLLKNLLLKIFKTFKKSNRITTTKEQ